MDENQQKLVDIIKRQTDYDTKTIVLKLKEYNNDLEKIIREYNGINTNVESEAYNNKSTNQKMFAVMRDFFN